jgi:hypothetical protein
MFDQPRPRFNIGIGTVTIGHDVYGLKCCVGPYLHELPVYGDPCLVLQFLWLWRLTSFYFFVRVGVRAGIVLVSAL